MTTMKKKKLSNRRILHDLNLRWKIRRQELKACCLANNLREKKKFCMFEFK